MSSRHLKVCIVGAGPRGLSVLERLCANAVEHAPGTHLTVHVADPYPAGAGRVWRSGQSGHLLMNTVASQVTMFTDPSVEIDGPVKPGPSLYEWAASLRLMEPLEGYGAEVTAEARDLGPDSYPTRAFYGRYLEWFLRHVLATAPENLAVLVHQARAIRLDDEPGGPATTQTILLDSGVRLGGLHAVVLAQGHVDAEPVPEEAKLASLARARALTYFPPANPADTDLSKIRPGDKVALRGLGLNFFDYMALLTLGRGGSFERHEGRLTYVPSGCEPVMYAGSRRGIPYHARGENQKGAHGRHTPLVLTPDVIAALRHKSAHGSPLDFKTDIWPLISLEVETVYYTTLLRSRARSRDAHAFQQRLLTHHHDSVYRGRLLDEFGVAPEDRWSWALIERPYGHTHFSGPGDYTRWLLEHLRHDVAQARAGNVDGPVKAALDVLRDLRNEVRQLVDHRGLSGRSHRDDLDAWYTPLNAFLSIGPPVRRIEQMIALIEAGLLHVVGPDTRIRPPSASAGFTISSDAVPGSHIIVNALIEARLPDIDLHRTTDPLLRHLAAEGQCRAYRIPDPETGGHKTGGLDVTARPYRLVDAGGRPHLRRFAYGVPTEGVHWATAAGIRPGVNSVTLGDSDAIARAVLALAARLHPVGPQPTSTPARFTHPLTRHAQEPL
ncbi:FAD/NAD(P)-binding protein [Actinocrinis puniceicyclus]|uniref:FAD/NAD(P)-binding protein n=1 Tax=Actinocrinis puniceicyclus TaxID=977794 RepID=A0A8J8BGW9_9ACTN|nr:FAD/NAD(P)-binding protein [Actinocrinis puniceicyclus]MBS2966204.1 FAD/NAD(P)-binding protein [Actinocrinis puniceicyclus]